MKNLILILFLFYSGNVFSKNDYYMSLDIKILDDLPKEKHIYLEVFGYSGEKGVELLIKKILIDRKKVSALVSLNYSMRGYFKIVNNDSLLSASSVVYLSEEKLSLECNIPGLIKVYSRENEFKELNDNLLFAIPAKVKNSNGFSTDKIKRIYSVIFEGDYYLEQWFAEYEKTVIRQVRSYKNYLHCLFSLGQNRSYLSCKTLDTCLMILAHFKGKTFDYADLYEYNEACKRTLIGQQLPTFSVSDTKGQIKNFKNQESEKDFILYDFWASWCIPCRKKNIEINKFYNKIDTSKFQIVSISLDDELSSWLGALKKDSIIWPSYIDITGQQGEIAKLFGLIYIPQNILVNKKGVVIQKNLNAEGLFEFINANKLFLSQIE